jgi:hypothetical protein
VVLFVDVHVIVGEHCLTFFFSISIQIRVITKLPNSEQSYKGKIKTHNYINRQNFVTFRFGKFRYASIRVSFRILQVPEF